MLRDVLCEFVWFCGGAFFSFSKNVYKDGDRINKGSILKRINGVPGISHEKQSLPPKPREHDKMGHGCVSS